MTVLAMYLNIIKMVDCSLRNTVQFFKQLKCIKTSANNHLSYNIAQLLRLHLRSSLSLVY